MDRAGTQAVRTIIPALIEAMAAGLIVTGRDLMGAIAGFSIQGPGRPSTEEDTTRVFSPALAPSALILFMGGMGLSIPGKNTRTGIIMTHRTTRRLPHPSRRPMTV